MRSLLLLALLVASVSAQQPTTPRYRDILDGTSNTVHASRVHELRFGTLLVVPTPLLARHLNLKTDQGLVVQELAKDSGGAKAGLQVDDIVLEVAGKVVPSNNSSFDVLLREIGKGKTVDVLVLRDGKPLTLKGLVVPELPDPLDVKPFLYQDRTWQYLLPYVEQSKVYQAPDGPTERPGWKVWSSGALTTTTHVKEDRFSTRQQEGTLVLAVHGTLKAGKAEVASIKIQDAGTERTFQRLDRVPAEYRDKVAELLELSERAGRK